MKIDLHMNLGTLGLEVDARTGVLPTFQQTEYIRWYLTRNFPGRDTADVPGSDLRAVAYNSRIAGR